MYDDGVSSVRALKQVQGSETIAAAFRKVEFPISKQELIRKLGNAAVVYDQDAVAPIAELVRGIPAIRFDSVNQARRAVDARWEKLAKNLAAIERAEELALERQHE